MLKIIDNCVGCKDMGLHCMGNSCPNKKNYAEFCDHCDDLAKYCIDDSAYCEDCAKKYLLAAFEELSIEERAEILNVDFTKVYAYE